MELCNSTAGYTPSQMIENSDGPRSDPCGPRYFKICDFFWARRLDFMFWCNIIRSSYHMPTIYFSY